jgi:NADH-quinone oxidoreductase chain I
MKRDGAMAWLVNIKEALWSTMVGMGITFRHIFKKPVTYQYPEDVVPVATRYRGMHFLEQDKCIACRACEKACPVDCIEIRFLRHPGSVNEWFEFSLDYNKCMFCELCCSPCPEDCIHEGKEFGFARYERSELVVDLTTWKGLRDVDHERIKEAEEEKKRKAAAMAAKKKAAAEKKAAEAKKAAETEKAPESKMSEEPKEPKEQKGEKVPAPKNGTSKPAPKDTSKAGEAPKPKPKPKGKGKKKGGGK